MARVNYTKTLAEEYTRLYKTCAAKSSQFHTIDKLVGQLISNRSRYENVDDHKNLQKRV